MKNIFKALLLAVPVTLLLHVSYNGNIFPLLSTGEGMGVRGISTFQKAFQVWKYDGNAQKCVDPHAWSENLPTIYVITPTYYRLMQKAELTRMSNTLLHVANLHWIVVEDSDRKSSMVRRLLENTGMNYTHLNVHITENLTSKGSRQRNAGLKWLRETFSVNDSHHGVVYFGDDDNTYSLELFDEMRYTKIVSVWPVAFAGGMRYESCKVNDLGKVSGWNVKYAPNRRFAIDMAGFAVNLQLLLSKSNVNFTLRGIPSGYQETRFLQDLVTLNELEPKADNCTKVLVWHTHASRPLIYNNFGNHNIET